MGIDRNQISFADALVEAAVDAIILIDAAGVVLSFNPGAEHIFGYGANEVLGNNVRMLMPEPDKSIHDGYLSRYLEGGDPRVIGKGREVIGQRKDRSTFPMQLAVNEFTINDKRSFVGVVRDISDIKAVQSNLELKTRELSNSNAQLEAEVRERKRSELDLKASDKRNRAIIDTAYNAFISLNVHDLITQWNPMAEQIFGWSRSEAIGRSLTETIIPPRYWDKHKQGLRNYLATGKANVLDQKLTLTALNREKVEFPIELTITAVKGASETEFHAFIQDITERESDRRRLTAQYETSKILSDAKTLEEAATNFSRAICEEFGWVLGSVWVVDREKNVLRSAGEWHATDDLDDFADQTRGLTLEQGEGFPGRAWTDGKPIWSVSLSDDQSCPRTPFAGKLGLRGGYFCPLSAKGDVIGVVEFFTGRSEELDDDLVNVLDGINNSLSQLLLRMQTQEQLSEQKQAYETLFRQSPDGISVMDVETQSVVYTNPAMGQMFGYDEKELEGMAIVDFVPKEQIEYVLSEFQAAAEGERSMAPKIPCLRKNGSVFLSEVTVTPRVQDGRPQLLGYFRDVTERESDGRRLAAQYEASKALAQASTIEEASVGFVRAICQEMDWALGIVWILDHENNTMHSVGGWHASANLYEFNEGTTGMVLEKGQGPPGRAWAEDSVEWVEDIRREPEYLRARLVEKVGIHGAIFATMKSGDKIVGVIELNSTRHENVDPGLTRMIETSGNQFAQFIERKFAEEEADRLKNEFFALVSHELRTPLTSMVGYLELLDEDVGDEDTVSDDGKQFLEVITRNTKRLQRLVSDLLFVAQMQYGSFELNKSTVDLNSVLSQSVDAAKPRATREEVKLHSDIQAVPSIDGDPDRLGQMVDNLITNALKFTPAGGDVNLKMSNKGRSALIEVQDTGPGISKKDQEHLFERFFRTESAMSDSIPGVGLGLSIVKTIAEGHRGKISVDSEEGKGATFSVELPFNTSAQSDNDGEA